MSWPGPPPPPPPVPWSSPPPASTPIEGPQLPHHRRGHRWIAVLGVVLALILATAVAGSVLFATQTWPPLSATYDFTDDLHHGRTDAAFAQVCDGLRTESTRVRFDAFARSMASANSLSVDVFSVRRNGSRATVEYAVRYSSQRRNTVKLILVEEHGDWRPCGTARAG